MSSCRARSRSPTGSAHGCLGGPWQLLSPCSFGWSSLCVVLSLQMQGLKVLIFCLPVDMGKNKCQGGSSLLEALSKTKLSLCHTCKKSLSLQTGYKQQVKNRHQEALLLPFVRQMVEAKGDLRMCSFRLGGCMRGTEQAPAFGVAEHDNGKPSLSCISITGEKIKT